MYESFKQLTCTDRTDSTEFAVVLLFALFLKKFLFSSIVGNMEYSSPELITVHVSSVGIEL